MKQEKIFIKNRKEQKLAVLIDGVDEPKGLAFVAHGLSGNKEQMHIETYAEAFLEKDFNVVRFDTTNTFGESDGNYADATVTNYYEDLEDVIDWTSKQDWYTEPFGLVGHSVGGMTTALYAENFPEKVKAIAPTSTVISGKLSLEVVGEDNYKNMKKRGWIHEKKGVKLKIDYGEDKMKYDLLDNIDKLTMPVLLVVGSLDDVTSPKHQKIFFDKLPGKKDMYVIEGAEHTFKESKHLAEIRGIFLKWIDEIAKMEK